MEQNHSNNNPSRGKWLRIAGYAVLAIVLLVAGLRLSLKTDWARTYVLNLVRNQARPMLQADLHIDRLEGDLWKEARFGNITISNQADTLLHIDTLEVGYRLLSVLGPAFEISHIDVAGSRLKLSRDSLKGWNWQRALEPTLRPADTVDTSQAEPPDFDIQRLSFRRTSIRLRTDGRTPDSLIRLTKLRLNSALGYEEGDWHARLNELSFDLWTGRLDRPVNISALGQMRNGTYTLERLALKTGRTFINANGLYKPDQSLRAEVKGEPVSPADVNEWMANKLLKNNLKLKLDARGQLRDFEVSLDAHADDLDTLHLSVQSGYSEPRGWLVRRMKMEGRGLRLDSLTQGNIPVAVDSLEGRLEGPVALDRWMTAEAQGALHLSGIRQGERRLERLDAQLAMSGGHVKMGVLGKQQRQRLQADFQLADLQSTPYKWESDLTFDHIDASAWMDSLASSDLSGDMQVEGTGLEPSDASWRYRGNLRDSRWDRQSIKQLSLEGSIDSSIVTNRGEVTLNESDLNWSARIAHYRAAPSYEYELHTTNLDLSDIQGMSDFESDLRMEVRGEGQGTSLQDMQLQTSVHIDSSVVNNERIKRFTCSVEVSDTTIYVRDGVLESDIASGTFSLRRHLIRYYDPGNRLDMELQLRDLSSLAPLAGIEQLQSRGVIKGSVHPDVTGTLELDASVKLNQVRYGDQLHIDEVEGRVHAFIMEQPEYLVTLELKNPTIASVVLQDLNLTSSGSISRERTTGDIELDLTSSSNTHFSQKGRFYAGTDSLHLLTTDLSLASSLRTMKLQHPFTINVAHQVFRMDTLRMRSGTAFLEAAVAHADSSRIEAYARGHELQAGIIQSTFLNESYFDGLLSGRMKINKDHEQYEASGDLRLTEFQTGGATLDTLLFDLDLARDTLHTHLLTYKNEQKLAEMRAALPFEEGPPSQLSDAFYERAINGDFRLYPTNLSEFEPVLNKMGYENTRGLARMDVKLHGNAGQPKLDGRFALTKARLSGVPIDSLVVGMDYSHQASQIALNASIFSLRQEAAAVSSQLPMHIDLSRMEVQLPEQQDSVQVDVTTRSFDLAALNDFVDRTQVNRLRGKVDGHVVLNGQMQDLKITGNMELSDGGLRIVPANVPLDKMEVRLNFQGDRVQLQHLSARSSGSFKGSGTVELNGLEPGRMNLNFQARNFKVVNTSSYQAFINLSSDVKGTLQRPVVTGNLSFNRGYIYLSNFGEKSVEEVKIDSLEGPDYQVSMYDSLSFDMDVSFNRNFFIRNKQYLTLELELDGQIDVLKDVDKDIQAFGSLEAVRGYAEPLGKRFNLDEGKVEFIGDPTNPDIYVKTSYRPPQPKQDITIWYIIDGNVESPTFRYESDPYLEMENILSYTLFGQPFYALDSWKQVVASPNGNGRPSNIAVDVLLDRVESLATRKLGIDVVQIDNTPSGANSGTTVKTGWYLSDRVFFAMLNELSGNAPKMMFIIQYLVRNNLEIILTQGDDIRSGIDFRWQFDY